MPPIKRASTEPLRSYTLFTNVDLMDYGLESWIVDQAAGVPRVILAAVSQSDNFRGTGGGFINQVAETFDRKVSNALSDTATAPR